MIIDKINISKKWIRVQIYVLSKQLNNEWQWYNIWKSTLMLPEKKLRCFQLDYSRSDMKGTQSVLLFLNCLSNVSSANLMKRSWQLVRRWNVLKNTVQQATLLRHNSQIDKTSLTNTEFIEHRGVYFTEMMPFYSTGR